MIKKLLLLLAISSIFAGCKENNSIPREPRGEEIEANWELSSDSIKSVEINSDGVAYILVGKRLYYCVDKDTQAAIEQSIKSETTIILIATKTRARLPKITLK